MKGGAVMARGKTIIAQLIPHRGDPKRMREVLASKKVSPEEASELLVAERSSYQGRVIPPELITLGSKLSAMIGGMVATT